MKENSAKCHSFLVTGNPGIGKTCFLLYLILRLHYSSEDKPKIFYSNSAENLHFFIDVAAKTVRQLKDADPLSVNDDWSNCYYFFDCSRVVTIINMCLAMKCHVTVLVSSPNVENYKHSQKKLRSSTFTYTKLFMPIWSFEEVKELQFLSPLCSNEDLECRFRKYGGCIRSILFPSDTDLDNTLRRQFIDLIESARVFPGDMGCKKGSSHQVFAMTPYLGDYTTYTLKFISEYVSEQMYKMVLTSTKMKLIEFLADLKGMSLAAGLRGSLFELHCHDQFVSVTTVYKLRNLQSKEESDFNVSASELEVYDELCKSDDPKTYYVPRSRTQPAYDSHLYNCAFQMTVSYKHPVMYHPLLQLKKHLDVAKLQLIFVVPEDIYPDFKLQTYKYASGDNKSRNVTDIEQFALCVNFKSD
jgi:hypothetical protein